jgi:hypothetical protein
MFLTYLVFDRNTPGGMSRLLTNAGHEVLKVASPKGINIFFPPYRRLPKHALNNKPPERRDLGQARKDGNASIPEQVKRPNARRKMMMIMIMMIRDCLGISAIRMWR